MANIKIALSIIYYDLEEAKKAIELFKDFSMSWKLLEEEKFIIPELKIIDKTEVHKEYIDNQYFLNIVLNMEFEGAFDNGSYLYPKTNEHYLLIKKSSSEFSDLDKFYDYLIQLENDLENFNYLSDFRSERLDDLYVEQIKPYIAAFVMTIVISYPTIPLRSCPVNVYCDGQELSTEYFIQSEYNEDLPEEERFSKLYKINIPIQHVWNWVISKINMFNDEDYSSPQIFTALSYILNRINKECLLFSILGLESIYAPESHRQRKQLKKNIKLLFHSILEEDIDEIYRVRSKFIHGEIKFSNYYLDCTDFSDYYSYDLTAKKAFCLVMATIQQLVTHNAVSIHFTNDSRFSFI